MAVQTPIEDRTDQGVNQPNTSNLIAGILEDAQVLFKQHVQLFQAEVEEDLRQTTQAGIQLVLGLATALIGGLMLAFFLVELLKLAGLPPWAAYGLLGLLIGAGGSFLVARALMAFQQINPLPEKTVEAIKENMEWQSKQN
jgi:hypothetical protein